MANPRRSSPSPRLPPLRYLNASEVEAAMPPIEERLALADLTMRALVVDSELPPKIGVHPRPDGSFAHAMPAFLRGAAADGSADGLGMKWVAGFASNRAAGLPAISAVVVLNDPRTGLPIAILDGAPITANRTAAVTGVAIRAFAPAATSGPPRVALIGAGVQGRSHLAVLGHVCPGLSLTIHDRHSDRAKALAGVARETPGIGSADVASTGRAAVDGADVVVTAVSFGPIQQVMTPDWLGPDATVIAVDYATYCSAAVARDAALFLVDERGQFEANRVAGAFEGYPDPSATIGEAFIANTPRPATGRIVVSHLGVGLADVVFGQRILREATRRGLGTLLER